MNLNNQENSQKEVKSGVNQGRETGNWRNFHRFYAGNVSFDMNNNLVLPESTAHQVLKVLRMKVGDSLVLTNGLGAECLSVIDSVTQNNKKDVSVIVKNTEIINYEERLTGSGVKREQIIACVPIIRKERFEWMLEKLSELHVDHVIPIITSRTLVKNISVPRLNKIIIEATEQSGGVYLPILHNTVNLPDLVPQLANINAQVGGELDFLTFDFNGKPILEFLQARNNIAIKEKKNSYVAFCVGPEGGFTEEESRLINSSCDKLNVKHSIVSFGGVKDDSVILPVLRTETAAVSAAVSIRFFSK